MFNTEFTFNTSVGYGQSENAQIITDKQIENILNKNKNILYKRSINVNFYKTIIITKEKIGLGDIIDFITKITGIKWFIIKITKGNCGCEYRKKLFNKWLTIPYIYIKLKNGLIEDPIIVDMQKSNNNKTEIKTTQIKKGCGCGRKK